MKEELNQQAVKLLLFIWRFKTSHEYSPSLREMGQELGYDGKWASTSVVYYYLRKLKAMGLANYVKGQSRTVYLTINGKQKAASLSIPHPPRRALRTRNAIWEFGIRPI